MRQTPAPEACSSPRAMKFTVALRQDAVEFEIHDQPGADAEKVDDDELRRRLGAPHVGEQLQPSMSVVRAIVGRLLQHPELPDDVKHTLALLDQAAQLALVAAFVEQNVRVVASEYRRKILLAQRLLAGDVPLGKNGIHVDDGTCQVAVTRLLEQRHRDFESAPGAAERSLVVEQVAEAIFWVVGAAPSVALIREALEVAGRKGRPRGSLRARSKNEVFNDLLREIGLGAASPEALKVQRKRRRRSGDM